jgi:hypothetical protein
MQLKGVSVRSLLLAIESAYGAEALARVKAALPAETRRRIEPIVLASSSYPVAVSATIHETVRTLLGGGSFEANRRLGREAARIDFGGVYRAVLRLADYPTLLAGLDRAWQKYNSQGGVRWTHVETGRAEGEIHGVEGFTEAMWQSIAARVETILELGGAKRATVTLLGFSSTGAKVSLRWTP